MTLFRIRYNVVVVVVVTNAILKLLLIVVVAVVMTAAATAHARSSTSGTEAYVHVATTTTTTTATATRTALVQYPLPLVPIVYSRSSQQQKSRFGLVRHDCCTTNHNPAITTTTRLFMEPSCRNTRLGQQPHQQQSFLRRQQRQRTSRSATILLQGLHSLKMTPDDTVQQQQEQQQSSSNPILTSPVVIPSPTNSSSSSISSSSTSATSIASPVITTTNDSLQTITEFDCDNMDYDDDITQREECLIGSEEVLGDGDCLPEVLVTLPTHTTSLSVNRMLRNTERILRNMHVLLQDSSNNNVTTTTTTTTSGSNSNGIRNGKDGISSSSQRIIAAKEAGRTHECIYANNYVDLGKIDTYVLDSVRCLDLPFLFRWLWLVR
jgi:hypothetical protein